MSRPAHELRDAAERRTRVIEEHLPLVEAIARRYAAGGHALDDLVQAGSIGLIKAVDRFDPQRGPPLAAFAARLIEGEIRHDLRARARHAGRAAFAPLPAAEGSADDQERAEARLFLERGWAVLSERERRLLALRYFGDLTQAEIAARVGISQAQVSRLLRGALERLGSELGGGLGEDGRPAYSEPGMATSEGRRDDERPSHSGRFLVRMPPSLHSELARTAEREGVSLNTLVTNALAGAIGWRNGATPGGDADGDHEPAAPPGAAPAAPSPPGPGQPGAAPSGHRWLSIALAANFAIVVVAALLAIVLLVLAWQT